MPDEAPVIAAPEPPAAPATPDWYEGLPPDLKVDKTVQTYRGKPVADVVKSLVDLNRLNGASIRLPKPEATPEEREKFLADIYGKLGRPESPDKYGTTTPALPDGTPWDAEGEKEFLATAHKTGLSKAQAQGVLDWYGARLTKGMEVQTAQMAETERELKKEWGSQYERNLSVAQQAASQVGGPDFVSRLEAKGLANDPIILRGLAAFGEALVEQKIISGDPSGQSAAGAQSKIDAIYANRDHPFHKGDAAAVEEVLKLTRDATGAAGRKVVATFG